MILAKVIGHVVSTIKLSVFKGFKLLLVQPIDANGESKGKVLLALDTVQAGVVMWFWSWTRLSPYCCWKFFYLFVH